MAHTHTIPMAVALIQTIEPALAAIGYHSALTGSVLYKGESNKDTDIIIFPHDPTKTKDASEIFKVLAPLGFSLRHETDGEYVNRQVYICGFNDRRVDLFFLQA